MNDQTIFNIAISTSLLGIIGILIFSSIIEPTTIKINEIDQNSLNKEITVEANVYKLHKSPNSNTYFLKLNDGTSQITLVIFEQTYGELIKSKIYPKNLLNSRIKVTGTVTTYKGSLELILKDQNSIEII